MHHVRKTQLLQVAAARLGDDADRGQQAHVAAAGLDQEAVHGGVEIRVIDDVVDVAVLVVVHPACRDRAQRTKFIAPRSLGGGRWIHDGHSACATSRAPVFAGADIIRSGARKHAWANLAAHEDQCRRIATARASRPVCGFAAPRDRGMSNSRRPGPARYWCGCARPGCAIPISRSSTATARARCRWCSVTRWRAWSRLSARTSRTCSVATTSSPRSCRAAGTARRVRAGGRPCASPGSLRIPRARCSRASAASRSTARRVNHHLGVSGFAEYATLSRRSLVRVDPDAAVRRSGACSAAP